MELHPIEIRVLGALIEKELTTPEYYPLTLNALVNACNQKSSREPVVAYDEDTALRALESLRQKGLVLRVSGAGHRVEKYAHSLGEKLNLGRREVPLLCVLMLRGPQTVGELRGRTERMHDFADLEEVESVLHLLAAREPEPFVTAMPSGRWAQLLGGVPESGPPEHRQDHQAIASSANHDDLADRVTTLEREMADLKQTLESFRKQFE
jgi:uncharacterized protein YceH (UPF0502 family)